MRIDMYTKAVLTAIAILLATIAFRPVAVQADTDSSYIFIEPGTTMLRSPDGNQQAQGKVMVDRRTGDIWGFPTNTAAPYPVNLASHEPPLSKPILLGRYDLARVRAGR